MELITAIRYPYVVYIISDGVDIFIIRREHHSKKKLLAVINGCRRQAYSIKHDKTTAAKVKKVFERIFPRNVLKKIMGLPFHDTNSTS